MKVSLAFSETLIYHDFPILFVGKDSIGGNYLCQVVDDSVEVPRYVAVAISQARLQALKLGKVDLHTVLSKPELGGWFEVTSFDEEHATIEPLLDIQALPPDFLPKPGALLPQASMLPPETFEAVKIGAVAKEAGMNPTLLRQYISGYKRLSPEQARRVQEALHRVGQRLLEVQFV